MNIQERRTLAKAQENKREAAFLLDVKWLLDHGPGRRIVWWILEQAGVFRDDFTSNSMTVSYIMGKRGLGLQLLKLLMDADTGALTRIMDQHERGKRDE